MAKEPKGARVPEDRAPQSADGGGGGMNTGVAIIGFILCFVAGAGLMWGYDKHNAKNTDGITAENDKTEGSDKGDGSKKVKGARGAPESAAFAGGGAAWSDEAAAIPISSKDPMWGKRDAPVTIVIFSDFQCPYCSKVEPTFDETKKQYGPDKVRIVWKNYPLNFHQNAKPAAEAAAGVYALAGNEVFWKWHATAFKNQNSLTQDNFLTWAKDAGVTDMAKFKKGLDDHTWAEKVEKDMEVATKVGVRGTPAMYVNGVFVNGAQPFDKFKPIVDQELAKANAKIAKGVAADKVYVAMAGENLKAAPKEDEEEKTDTKTVFKVPVGTAPILGNVNAPVTIVVFSDFQCPFCKKVEPTLKTIRDKYGDKVRMVWKDEPLPFHNRAFPTANFAREARAQKGMAGFWAAHDKLFENQGAIDDDALWKYAGELGLNVEQVKAAVTGNKYKKDIEADMDLGEDVQASGTPHFFINGRRLVGAQPDTAFTPIIDDEIKKAGELASKGVKPAEVYDALIKDGKGTPEPEKKTVALPANAPFRGNANAKVTIQMFSDFECPFCQRVEPTLAEVMKTYGDKVKLIWRDMPLPMHPSAPMAAAAAREAFKQKGNPGFWAMHDKMFTVPPTPPAQPGQPPPQPPQRSLSRETLDKYAQEIGLDMAAFKAALDSSKYKADVDAEAKVGNDAGISGTPAFVINGYFINGAQPFSKFRKLIERALAEAK